MKRNKSKSRFVKTNPRVSYSRGGVMVEYTIVTLALAAIFWVAIAGPDRNFEPGAEGDEGIADILQEKQRDFRSSIQQP